MIYGLYLWILAILCMVYVFSLISSTKQLMNTTPCSNEVVNFKAMTMVDVSRGKIIGIVFIIIGLIVLAIAKLWITPSIATDFISMPLLSNLKILANVLLLVWAAAYLYTQTRLNRLFNKTDITLNTVPFNLRAKINSYVEFSNLTFILFCMTLAFQIILYGFNIV